MADEETAVAEAGEGEETTTEETTEETSAETTEEPFDRDRAMATIRAQRESEEALKAENREIREELRDLKRSGLSEGDQIAADLEEARGENETLKSENESLKGELATIRRQALISEVANRYDAYDAEEVGLLLSEEDTADKASTERAIKRLKKEKPRFFKPERPSGGQITPGAGEAGADMNDFIRSGRGR